mgnify:CR=1 FL=1
MGLGLPDIHCLWFVDQYVSEKMMKHGVLTSFRKWLRPNVTIAPAEKKSDPNDNTSDDDGDEGDVSIIFYTSIKRWRS